MFRYFRCNLHLIHHGPLCFRTLDKAGLLEAFLAAVQAGVMSLKNEVLGACMVHALMVTGGQKLYKATKAEIQPHTLLPAVACCTGTSPGTTNLLVAVRGSSHVTPSLSAALLSI